MKIAVTAAPGGLRKVWGHVVAAFKEAAKPNPSMARSGSVGELAIARARARVAENRLREAMDALPEGIVFLDKEGRYVMWNAKYAEIYACSADLFKEGARLADTLRIGVGRGDYPQAVGREEEWLAERLALMNNPGVRHEQRLASGRWIMIEERRTAEGGIIGLRVDITELKAQAAQLEAALEEANAASKAKTEFLASMSHEIKTPLNGVIGLADVLSRTRLDEDQRDILKTLTASAGDLDCLLDDLLDFSQLQAGKIEIKAAAFDLPAAVLESIEPFSAVAKAKGLNLVANVDQDVDGAVLGDVARLKQVLTNLVSNAVKFTEKGEVCLNVRRSGAGAILFEVKDTGVGFDQAKVEQLFGGFEKADASLARKFGGTGLGLSICRHLAGLMGGAIHAAGEVGKGATFTVILPLEAVAETPQVVEPQEYPPLKVLLVDDNATNRKVVDLMLTPLGAQVLPCENGREAVAAFYRQPFDLILMDLQMPVMDGLSATAAIREIERVDGKHRTPLIVLSANFSPADRAATAKAGADAHLAKPIRADELISTLMAVMEASDVARAEAA